MASTTRFEIKVKGESSIALPAERAILRIVVTSTGLEKQPISAAVVASGRKVEELLRQDSRGPGAALSYWSRSSLSESKNTRYDHNQNKSLPTEYTSRIDFDAHFQKFQAIGPFISSVSEIAHCETQPVEWSLLDETKEAQRSTLRSQAAKTAYRKALDYAGALGYSNVIPVTLHEGKIQDASAYRKGMRPEPQEVTTTRKNLANADEDWEEVKEPLFRYQPQDIKMTLTVETVFHAVRDE